MSLYARILAQLLSRLLLRAGRKLQVMRRPSVSRSLDFDQLQSEQLTFAAPCFVLSTGRCGTRWLTELLRLSRCVWANHSHYPELIRHSRLAYEEYRKRPDVFQQIIRATRDEWIANAYRHGQIYVETNSRITFFARAIRSVYPRARFIHLVRHPGDFVRSGMSRGWYSGDQRHDLGRIVKAGGSECWQRMTDIERIAWLWNETNRYIETFSRDLSAGEYTRVKAEDMFRDPSTVLRILDFLEVSDIPLRAIVTMQRRQINRQRKWASGPFETWPDEEKQKVRTYAVLAERYHYEL